MGFFERSGIEVGSRGCAGSRMLDSMLERIRPLGKSFLAR